LADPTLIMLKKFRYLNQMLPVIEMTHKRAKRHMCRKTHF